MNLNCFLFSLITFSPFIFGLQIEGGSPFAVDIGRSHTTLTIVDVTAQTDNEILKIENREFSLQTTWAVFALTQDKEYNLSTWDIAGNCGCSTQICGQDCPGVQGVDCDSNIFTRPASCWFSSHRGYCWNFVKTGSTQNYTLYNLSHVSTLALTSYGGPNIPFVSPGFTIQNKLKKQDYALNALITGVTSLQKSPLTEYRYAESEGRLVSLKEFAQLITRPSLSSVIVDLEQSQCPQEGNPAFQTKKLVGHSNADSQLGFHYYMILRKSSSGPIADLFNRYILTPKGLLKWSNHKNFEVFDPCNQQFLTLQTDEMKNYFTVVPDTQTLMKDIVCIAISDIKTNIYDLVLYELNNGHNQWKPSDRFRGLLSNDYVETLNLRITQKSSLPIIPPQAQVEVGINVETDRPVLTLKTTQPVECKIYLSPDCVIDMKTSAEQTLVYQPIEQSCSPWYEVGRFFCEGLSGNFYPPPQFTLYRLSGYDENTTISVTTITTNSPVNNILQISWFAKKWRNLTFLDISLISMFLILIGTIIFKISRKSRKLVTKIGVVEETEQLIQDELQNVDEDFDPVAEYVKTKRMRNALYRMWEDSIVYTDSKKDN